MNSIGGRSGRALIVGPALLLLALSGGSCAQLHFLKSPSVPTPKGASRTDPGSGHVVPVFDADDDWLTYNRTLRGDRFAPQAEITSANVAELRQRCTFALGEKVTFQSGPIEIGGTLFVTSATSTWAIDATTCALRWKHTYDYSPHPDFDLKVNRGVAFLDGRLFRGANDGRVYALDAATGEELWNVVVGQVKRGETFPAAPIAFAGLVFIGNAGGDNFGVVGRMMALDARTGGRVWSTPLVAQNGADARTWPASTEEIPRSGGATWTSYTLDTLGRRLFVATGNAGPDFQGDARPGSNRYTTSVVELDAGTGILLAHHSILDRDVHDWDVAAAPLLVRTAVHGEVLVAAGKDGHVHGIDRDSGKRLFRTAVTRVENIEAPLTTEGTHFCPGINGGVEWNGPSYSPRLNTLYVNSIEWCSTVKLAPLGRLEGKNAIPWTGSAELTHPFGVNDSTRRGQVTAIDADDGSIRWKFAAPTPMVAGVTATAGGIVLTGDLNGTFYAFDARSGKVLLQHALGAPIGGGVISYAVGGRQYLAVAVGMDAPLTWQLESGPAKVVVLGL